MSTDRVWELLARKLAGEASGAELQELDHLIRVNPELHLSMQTITDLWYNKLPSDMGASGLAEAYHKHLERMHQMGIPFNHPEEDNGSNNNTFLLEQHPSSRKKKIWWAAAAAALVSVIGWLIFSPSAKPPAPGEKPIAAAAEPNSEISTKYGSKTTIHLPDGSQVWLNAGSKLTYNKKFGTGIREVTLAGEAYFDVVKNPEAPFIIHTARMDIKVLGTQFNVKSYPGEKTTEASLVHGSIEVSIKDRPSEKIILKPNEKIIVSGDSILAQTTERTGKERSAHPAEAIMAIKNLTYQEKDSAIIETAWVQNKLIFKEESFADLALKMERWYGVKFEFSDPSLTELHFTGIFETESVQQALRALKLTAAFNFRFKDSHTVIISKINHN